VTEPSKLTILDVARLAGVSRSTVSRVMNGRDDVGTVVRARVLQVIDETGFRPSATARSLVSRRTGVLGLAIPWRVSELLEDPYFVGLIRGISRASNAAGTTLSFFLFETEEEERDLHRRVVAPGLVDGLMLAALRKDDPLLDEVADSGLPMVSLGRVMHRDDVSWVDVDNLRARLDAGAEALRTAARPKRSPPMASSAPSFAIGICGSVMSQPVARPSSPTTA